MILDLKGLYFLDYPDQQDVPLTEEMNCLKGNIYNIIL